MDVWDYGIAHAVCLEGQFDDRHRGIANVGAEISRSNFIISFACVIIDGNVYFRV